MRIFFKINLEFQEHVYETGLSHYITKQMQVFSIIGLFARILVLDLKINLKCLLGSYSLDLKIYILYIYT